MSYRPVTQSSPVHTSTINAIAPLQRIESGTMMLPDNPIQAAMGNPGLSLTSVIVRAQHRAATHREALDLYKTVIIDRMKQQADVLLHGGELMTTARKNEQLNAFVEANMDLVNVLIQRIADMDARLFESDFATALDAQQQANLRRSDIERRHMEGRIDASGRELMLRVVDSQLSYRIEASSKRTGQFLQQVETLINQTVDAISGSIKRSR